MRIGNLRYRPATFSNRDSRFLLMTFRSLSTQTNSAVVTMGSQLEPSGDNLLQGLLGVIL